MEDFNGRSKKFFVSEKGARIYSQFSRKVFLLLNGLFEGNENENIV